MCLHYAQVLIDVQQPPSQMDTKSDDSLRGSDKCTILFGLEPDIKTGSGGDLS